MTRRPFPETKTTCHARNGCCVSNKVRAVLGILTVTAKSVKASQNEAFAARTAIVSIISDTVSWEDTGKRRGYSGLLRRLRRNEDLGEKGYHRLNNMLLSNQAVPNLSRLPIMAVAFNKCW